jgi:hypothetical protein
MFRPGRSGNPDGRPKALKEVEELARERIPAAIEALAHIAEHFDSDQARVAAANALLDRAVGKPLQTHAGDDEAPPIRRTADIVRGAGLTDSVEKVSKMKLWN